MMLPRSSLNLADTTKSEREGRKMNDRAHSL